MKVPSIFIYSAILMMSVSNLSSAPTKNETGITPKIKEETVIYALGASTFKGFVAYDENRKGKLPIVLLVHEWWGLNDYAKIRARKLAELGYFAFAVDMFGDGKIATTPEEAMSLTKPFYGGPELGRDRIEAALEKAKTFANADASKTAAIGYCFGGAMVLNAARLGSDFKGVVSFHGGLKSAPPQKNVIKADILVCHGDSDAFVNPDVNTFKKQMDSVGAKYTFKHYANATHAFTNPASTETGKKFNMPIRYNEEADKKSWEDMREFLNKVFK